MNHERQLFNDWLVTKNLKERTIKEYLSYYDKFSNEKLNQGSVNIFLEQTYSKNNVARAFIENLRSFYLSHKKELGLTPEDNEEIREFVTPKLTGRKEVKIPEVIPETEVLEIEKCMTCERDKLMLLLSYYCGLRLQELIQIRPLSFHWKQFDADEGRVGELTVFGKGGKQGIAIVPPDLMKRVRKWINTEEYRKINNNDYLFTGEGRKNKISSFGWNKILGKASKKALGKGVNPHLLRHSIASSLLKKGTDVKTIQEFLRHSSIATTQIYLHMDKEDLKNKVLEKIQG